MAQEFCPTHDAGWFSLLGRFDALTELEPRGRAVAVG